LRRVPGEGRGALRIDTPAGPAEVVLDLPAAPPQGLRALLVLGHGAGGDVDAPDLRTLTARALDARVGVALVRQPYRVAGRRAPAPAAQLDTAWTAVVGALRAPDGPFAALRPRLRRARLFVGGRSSGARVACRTAHGCGASGVVALSFPLHPPGRPERSRAAELTTDVPLLVLQGSRDAFGTAAQFPAGVEIVEVAGADHALRSPAFDAAAREAVAWMLARAPAPSRARAGA
jgi:predicted alpha/beta-hydrolase family hydrolase